MSTIAITIAVLLGITCTICIAIAWSRKEEAWPRCGQCKYNLTGCQSIRCPECGMLFVDAGINPAGRWHRRHKVALSIAAILTWTVTVGLITSLEMYRAANRRMTEANQIVLQQRALRAAEEEQLQKLLTTAQQRDMKRLVESIQGIRRPKGTANDEATDHVQDE